MRVVAVTQTYDRVETVQVCLPAWAGERDAARAAGLAVTMEVHDDGSKDPAVRDLGSAYADTFRAHEHVEDKNRSWGIAQGVRRNIELALRDPAVEWVYVCDSDTYPVPGFWERVAAIVRDAPADAYSFYSSSWHAQHYPTHGRTVTAGGVALLRRETSPGASFMMRASRLRELGHPYGITKEAHAARGAWDFVLANALQPVLVTEVSLVEHFGAGGIHNVGSFDIDRAVNPAPELAALRPEIIARLSGRRKVRREPPTKEQPVHNPRTYWAEQFQKQGHTYVASSRDEYESQADAFFEQLGPRIDACMGQGDELILDYGCGVGRLAGLLRQFCSPPHLCRYVGADINTPALEHAREHNPGLDFLQIGPGNSVPIADGAVDLVVAATVLQHVPEVLIGDVARELRRVLAPAGRVLLIEDANPERLKPAPHMNFRPPERYAELLGLRMTDLATFTAERRLSHYIIELRA